MVSASFQSSLKWDTNKDVKFILFLIIFHSESAHYMNRYAYARGERGFFPLKGWNDERQVAGP